MRKLRIMWLALLLLALAGTFAVPVKVVRPVIGSDGQPVLMQDGSKKMESDPWRSFKVNWFSNSLAIAGCGIVVFALGNWIFSGISGAESKGNESDS